MDNSSTDTSDDEIKTPLHSPTLSRNHIASLPLEHSFDECKKENTTESLLETHELCRWRGSPFVTRRNKIRTTPIKIELPPKPENIEEENHSIFWFLWEFFRILFTFFFGFLRRFMSLGNRLQVSRTQQLMDSATNYAEWETAALKMDELKSFNLWKETKMSALYDVNSVEFWMNQYRTYLSAGDLQNLILALRSGLTRNVGGIGNSKLFDYSIVGTKKLVEEYESHAINALEWISLTEFDNFPPTKKLDFFYELRRAFGKSALLLSGGATMGMYHIGVVKALFEEGLLPQVVSGTSAGSLVAALLCSLSNEELPQLFKPPFCGLGTYVDVPIWKKLVHLVTDGVFMDMNHWQSYVSARIGDITFKEAYEKTGRILNISVASTQRFEFPTLLNYITAPNVVIYSAVCASCALPLVFKPVNLLAKDRNGNISFYHSPDIKWRDGSIGADLPMRRLAELFAVNHFIVSQVNPHVAPFLRHTETKKTGVRSTLLYFLKSELRHRTKQLAELGLIRGFLSTIEPVVLQTYHGDITIVPPFVLKNYAYLFSKPDDSFITSCIDVGCRNTWTRIPIIKNHLAIEQCLENCCERLKRIVYNDNIDRKNNRRVYKLRKSTLK